MANTIVGLDLGTTKIACIIAEVDRDELKIVGVGTCNSTEGLRRGVVVNLEKTAKAIEKAVSDAEQMAGIKVDSVYAGIAGDHIRSINSRGVIAVARGSQEITQSDVDRVIDAAQAVYVPMDREMLHVIPQGFIVDTQRGIKDPIGMSGVRLEAEVHIVTGAVTSAQNLIRCANSAVLNVHEIVLEQLASSESVLTQDEKDLGVALVDIGGGTSDLAIFANGSIKHTAVLALGGNQVTTDLAFGLQTPIAEAEEIKKKWGCCRAALAYPDETIEVQGVGGRGPRTLSRGVMSEIIEPRVNEIFSLIKREIQMSGFEDMLSSGLVLTGGSSLIAGIEPLAEEVFQRPVRVGVPVRVGGLTDVVSNPQFATAVGLLLYGKRDAEGKRFSNRDENSLARVVRRVRAWFEGLFF